MLDQRNLNADPLHSLSESAIYLGYAGGARTISTLLSRRTYPLLNSEAIYIGRRPHFRRSTLEKFIKSRTGAILTGGESIDLTTLSSQK